MTEYEKRQHAAHAKHVDLLIRVKKFQHPLTHLLNLMGRSDIKPEPLGDIKTLDKAFASVYNIVELIPYLMRLKYRRTILDDLYPGMGREINAAYVNFLENPGKYADYYVPKTDQTLADLEDATPYDPRMPPRRSVGELIYTFDDINKYKEENQYELKDIASPPLPPPPPPPDIYDEALAAMLTATPTATPPPPSSTDDIKLDAGDILAAASKKFLESKTGGSSRKYLRIRRRFKKSKSKSKSKKSKSKSKTKPKLKSKSKTKYRKQNK